MTAKPEKQAKREKEWRDEEEESEKLIKIREEAEAEFDALWFDDPTKSEIEKRAEEAERKILLKMRQDQTAQIRSAYKSTSDKAAPLEESESELRDEDSAKAAPLEKSESATVWGPDKERERKAS